MTNHINPASDAVAPRIAVLGSFMQAICWKVDHLPQRGESVLATGFSSEPAGKGLAVAVGCRRLGATVDLLLAVGNDEVAEALMKRLLDEGLPTHHVHSYPGPSGHGAGWLSADGANAIAAFVGANSRLDASQIALASDVWISAALVYAQFETPVEAIIEAFTQARRHGRCTVLNPSPWQALTTQLLACTQVLIVNELEAAQWLPDWPKHFQPDEYLSFSDSLRSMWAIWPGGLERLLVVTLGARGSIAFAPTGDMCFAPPFAVNVGNSIGAGDAFAAGWCASASSGHSVMQCLRYGNACGALAASHDGILDALPFANDVEIFLKSTS